MEPGATTPRRLADATARRRQVAVAGHEGDVAAAEAHLDDPAPAVRATALRALARAGHLGADHLRGGAADPDATVRRAVAELLAGPPAPTSPEGDDARAELLLGLLGDDQPTVVEVAAWAAGEQPPAPPGVLDRLVALTTGHDDALVREAAVAALGSLGDPAGLGAILAATTDKATVRRRAVLALAPFEGDEVDAALERARTDRDAQVRQAAEDLLDG